MFNMTIIAHLIPFDGKWFDDPQQAIFSLITLNLIVFALIVICLLAVRDSQRRQKALRKAQRSLVKAQVAEMAGEPAPAMAGSAATLYKKPERKASNKTGLEDLPRHNQARRAKKK